jgi:hypothetical protein
MNRHPFGSMHLRISAGAAVLAGLLALPAAAQERTTSLVFLPRAGALVQTGALGDAPVSTQIQGAGPETRRADVAAGAIVGFAVVLDRGTGLLLRGDVDWAPARPVRLEERRSIFDASLAVLTAGLMTRPAPAGWVQPYLTAGAGFRSYRFSPWASAGPQLPSHRLDVALRLGAGAQASAGPLTFTLETQDLVSSFRFDEVQGAGGGRAVQNDLAFLLGLRFVIR